MFGHSIQTLKGSLYTWEDEIASNRKGSFFHYLELVQVTECWLGFVHPSSSQFFVLLMQKCHFSGWKISPAASRQLRICVSSLSWKSRAKADRDAECRINCANTCTVWFCSQKKRYHSALTSQVLSEYNVLSLSLRFCTLCVLNLCLLSQCATKPTTDDREQGRPANEGEKKSSQAFLSFPLLQLQCFWFPQEDDDRGEFPCWSTYIHHF